MKGNMKLRNILGIVVLIALILLMVYYVKNNLSDFRQLSFENPGYIIILALLLVFSYCITALITKNLLLPLGVKLGNFEAFVISIITGFYNLITPFRGGMAARAVYLKKKHNFSYTDFLASLSASYVLVFLIASFLGLLSGVWIYLEEGIFSWIIFLVFLCVFIPLLFIVVFSPKFKERENKWLNRIVRVVNGWHLIKNNKRVIILVSFLTLVQLLIGMVSSYLSFMVFGIEISLVKCLFLTAIGNIGMLLQLTPANLGVGEAITVFSASTIGIGIAESLSVAILGRIVGFLVLFILGPLFSYMLLKKK